MTRNARERTEMHANARGVLPPSKCDGNHDRAAAAAASRRVSPWGRWCLGTPNAIRWQAKFKRSPRNGR